MSRAWLITGKCIDSDYRSDTWVVGVFTCQQRADWVYNTLTEWLEQTIDLFNRRLAKEREGIAPKSWEEMFNAHQRAVTGVYTDLKPELDPKFQVPYAESSANNSYKIEEVKLDTRVMLGVECR